MPQNPTAAERITVVATGGYGRGELAPGSDVDLLFVRPFKQTAWGESVIEFILYMLWDLGLKVGHATRAWRNACAWPSRTSPSAPPSWKARYLWGDKALYDELRKKFWTEVATGSGRDFVEAKLAERDQRHERQGISRYLVEPNIKEGKGGLRDLQTLYWIGKYLYHVEDAADLVEHGVFTKDEYKTFQKAEAFLWNVRVHLHYLVAAPRNGCPSTCSRPWPPSMGYTNPDKPRRAVEAFMRAYFLTAKDVGDLTRIFCAALEVQQRKQRPSLSPHPAGLFAAAHHGDDFYVENGRLTADPAIFRQDPVNILRIFQIADAKQVDIHPDALRTITRALDLINDKLRANPEANAAFLSMLTSRQNPEWALRLMTKRACWAASFRSSAMPWA